MYNYNLIRDAAKPQQQPTESEELPVILRVMQDLLSRAETGVQKYGTPLKPNNGRDALLDAYQEALDLCMYLRQAIDERNKTDKDTDKGQKC